VAEVAVIGLPHEKWIEMVTAVVVPKEGVCDISQEEIIETCRERLAPFKVPKKVIFVDSLPKSPTGKILKRMMRETYGTLQEP
jgi:fatty-acyl-CoA synthase